LISGLDSLPKGGLHRWADYAELVCLATADGVVSEADLVERLKERKDVGEAAEADFLDDPDEETAVDAEASAPQADRRARQAADVFRHLVYRRQEFGPGYPFRFSVEGSLRTQGSITQLRRLYLFLLLCSSLRFVQAKRRQRVTVAFERLSARIVGALLPEWGEAHIFGTASVAGERYRGTLFRRLSRLADDLRVQVAVKKTDIATGGDLGCDVAAWLPMDDSVHGLISVIGQATCEGDWRRKQYDSSHEAWQTYLTSQYSHNNVVMIPFCYRDPTGGWYGPAQVSSVLIDRVRIFTIAAHDRALSDHVPNEMVEEFLQYREPLT
jgi:hypothetical protein